MSKENILQKLQEAVINCDPDAAKNAAEEALRLSISPLEAIEKGLAKGVREIGDRYGRGEAFLPELIMAGEAMKAGMHILRPMVPKGQERKGVGGVLIGTVAGDLHDIGKNIVVSVLEANGFEVHDMGTDVPAETFLKKISELKPDTPRKKLGSGTKLSSW